MKLKICFNNETHRISKPPDTFETLSQLISSIFLSKLPSNWILEYIDSDGDKVMLADEQDYRELMASNLDNSSATTAVKVFITSKLPGEEIQIPSVEVIDDLKQESEEDLQQIEERVDDRLFKLETLSVSMLDELLKASPLEEDVESNPEINMEVKKDEEIEKIILDPVMAPSLAADMCKYLQKPTLNFENKPDLNPSKKKDKSKKKQKKSWKKIKKAKLVPPPAKQNLVFLHDLSDKENREPVYRESKDMEGMINRAIEKQVPRIAKMTQDYLAAENQKNDQKVYHHGINCGNCFTTPIIGVRYRCSICSNFDFCEKCEQTNGHPHAFIKIKTPDQPYSHPSILNHLMPHPPMLMPFPQGFMPPPPFMHPPPFNPNQGPPFRPPPMYCPRPGPMRPMPFPGQGEPMRFPLHPKPFMEMPNSPSMNNSMIFQRQENNHIRQFLSPNNENVMPNEPQEKHEIKVPIDLMESLNAMVQVEREQEIKSEEIKNEMIEMPTIVIESNDECKKPLPMPKRFYSKTTRAKAKHLKQLLPDVDKEELLRFIHESPKELDLLELLENFQH